MKSAQDSRPNPVYLYRKPLKTYRYACSKSPRRVSLRPIRESLPDKGPSGSPRPRRIRGRVQGKAHAKQKEIRNNRKSRFIPYLCVSFYHRIALSVLDRRARFAGRGFLLPVVWVSRPYLFGQFRTVFAHIIVHV